MTTKSSLCTSFKTLIPHSATIHQSNGVPVHRTFTHTLEGVGSKFPLPTMDLMISDQVLNQRHKCRWCHCNSTLQSTRLPMLVH